MRYQPLECTQRVLPDDKLTFVLMVIWLPWYFIATYVTIGTTNINITLSFVLHIGRDVSAYEMNTKFENIL